MSINFRGQNVVRECRYYKLHDGACSMSVCNKRNFMQCRSLGVEIACSYESINNAWHYVMHRPITAQMRKRRQRRIVYY